ncbi:Cadmium/zinc-transporting ATPase HMA2 [Dendrobium catenatum]|uniref:Cadmium/zinc-transporting ATPase HMA2 n=1 Tax=Dendrobium catenatum TaxID=906689 RepID=A0A2I0VKI3_9ASPA|nr:Cadmium/zinc-transporting ATPase HMA2 [Dendrobium catenatum]
MSLLMNLAPQKAILAETDQIVDANDVKVGTILAIKAGEVIPIDGIVVEGKSEVDEKSLTGESFPVAKQLQSLVWAGTLNIDGYISVKTTALAEHSAVAKMARLVEEAQNNKSKTQRIIDCCAKYYTPGLL